MKKMFSSINGLDWGPFDPMNPHRLYIIKTRSVRLYQFEKDFTMEDLKKWLEYDDSSYTERCLRRCREQKHFTFSGFDDLLDFMTKNKYIPGIIRVMIERNGDMTIAHGRHRWAAAYLCGIGEMQAHLCKRINKK